MLARHLDHSHHLAARHEVRRWRRHCLAVLAIDLVGFSRMVELDAHHAAICLTELRYGLIRPTIAHYRGRIFSVAGDGHMAAFALASAALGAAIAIQRALLEGSAERRSLAGARLRMGISFGPVLEVDGEFIGHPLNVAARLEALSPPGAIYLCGSAFDAIAGNVAVPFTCIGETFLRKMASACRVYTIDIASGGLDRREVELDHA